jgi:uncharacterized membrane protein YraQ (UPF0718 family)
MIMADITQPPSQGRPLSSYLGGAWGASVVLVALIALLDPPQLQVTLTSAANSLWSTAPFILFAVLAVAYLKATGAENLLARAFEGNPLRMVVMAALLGGLSPFCSCEVIPFIAALLALGAPLGAVMAFWLASPLMDPAMFLITSGTLGWEFAIAKTVAAVSLGIFGGLGMLALSRSVVFANPLREKPQIGGCCGVQEPFTGKPQWKFWSDADRREVFKSTALENGVFLLKWLTLAYVIETMMIAYIPAELIASVLGGTGIGTIIMGALVGAPAYLNGYAAVPLVDGLLAQGMSQGAAMSFVIAGGVSCIPAAIAVWALVKPRVFAAYLSFAIVGAIIAGLIWQILS